MAEDSTASPPTRRDDPAEGSVDVTVRPAGAAAPDAVDGDSTDDAAGGSSRTADQDDDGVRERPDLRTGSPHERAEAEAAYQEIRRSPGLTYAFWFLLGIFGAHRFYVGDRVRGALMFVTLGGLGVWTLIDVFFIGQRLEDVNATRRATTYESLGLRPPAVPPVAIESWFWSRVVAPVLGVLFILLVGAGVALWVTRPGTSAVRTDDYVGALQAARAGIVDVASFDYVTLDDDIKQIRNVTTGDLQKESVDQLDQRRQQITDAHAVVNTTVVGAAVGKADQDSATVFAVIQSTQQTSASGQAQVQRYRVEIALERVDGRWLLSGITGR